MESTLIFILLLALHTYLGYPAILGVLGRVRPHRINPLLRPRVTVLVAAYNEIDVIEGKIRNSLALDYPEGLIDYVFASDGSEDGTTEVIKGHESDRLHLVKIHPRGGKARALRMAIPFVKGEIIVLSDANTMIATDAVQKLVRHFESPEVGAVSGDVRIEKSSGGFGESEGLYYRLERFIQRKESESGSIIGVDGALYAIRKELFFLPDDNVILDDFVISMNVLNSCHRVLYDPEALASENATPAIIQEIRRKSRVISGGFQALSRYNVLPGLSNPWGLFCFLSHKVLRWVMPVLLLVFAVVNVAIVTMGSWWGYTMLLYAQITFYLLGIAGWLKEKEWKTPVFSIPFYFTMVNVAGILGVVRFLGKTQKVTWKKADRSRAAK